MSAQVIPFRSRTQRLIDRTQDAGMRGVIIIGYDSEGRFYTDAADVSNADTAFLLLLAYWHFMLGVQGHE
jgi:hypothetical protein